VSGQERQQDVLGKEVSPIKDEESVVNVDDMTSSINHDVAIVPILDLEEIANERIRRHRLHKIETRLAHLFWLRIHLRREDYGAIYEKGRRVVGQVTMVTCLKYCVRVMQPVRFLRWCSEMASGMYSIKPLFAEVTSMRNLRFSNFIHENPPGETSGPKTHGCKNKGSEALSKISLK